MFPRSTGCPNGNGGKYDPDVTFEQTNPNSDTWEFLSGGTVRGVADDEHTTIVNLTKDGELAEEPTLRQLFAYYERNKSTARLAFTVDPTTKRVDYVYIVNEGWDSRITLAVDKDYEYADDFEVISGPIEDSTTGTVTIKYKGDLPYITDAKVHFQTDDNGVSFAATYDASTKTFTGTVSGLTLTNGVDKTVEITGVYSLVTVKAGNMDDITAVGKWNDFDDYYTAPEEPVEVPYGGSATVLMTRSQSPGTGAGTGDLYLNGQLVEDGVTVLENWNINFTISSAEDHTVTANGFTYTANT